ncbi:AT-rich interactive domain-containing protein 4A [Acipenser ruthenus]|uniref:AT-rich interactive domain-containing protein 4A n=1 Tax=Acipenser ruthenus TaxID=7906 RepID=A0A444V0B7_ACIRT|nr:AT-rich interactive domain-containing protein 4A [Acipenser ruthenus]
MEANLSSVISPSCNDDLAVKKDQCLVRSFADSRFYTISRKDIRELDMNSISKSELASKKGIQVALTFLKTKAIPESWKMDMSEILESSSSEEEDGEGGESDEDEDKEVEEEETIRVLLMACGAGHTTLANTNSSSEGSGSGSPYCLSSLLLFFSAAIDCTNVLFSYTISRKDIRELDMNSISKSELASKKGIQVALTFLKTKAIPESWKMDMSEILESSSSEEEDGEGGESDEDEDKEVEEEEVQQDGY